MHNSEAADKTETCLHKNIKLIISKLVLIAYTIHTSLICTNQLIAKMSVPGHWNLSVDPVPALAYATVKQLRKASSKSLTL